MKHRVMISFGRGGGLTCQRGVFALREFATNTENRLIKGVQITKSDCSEPAFGKVNDLPKIKTFHLI